MEVSDQKKTLCISCSVANLMLFSLGHLLSFISHHIRPASCGLLLTGTPDGVGPLHDSDELIGLLDDTEYGRQVRPVFSLKACAMVGVVRSLRRALHA